MPVIIYASLCLEGAEHNAACALLAHAVARERNLSSLPEISRKSGGKPYFPSHPDLHFNLSHSRGGIVCALHDRPVGVDIEKLRPAPRRLASGMSDEEFFRLWTAREASVKREGQGIAKLLRPSAPDPLCQTLDDLLPGYIITVCPSEEAEIRAVLTAPDSDKTPRNYERRYPAKNPPPVPAPKSSAVPSPGTRWGNPTPRRHGWDHTPAG